MPLIIPKNNLYRFTHEPTHILLHWSASPFGDAEQIDQWHRNRPEPFTCIGYHYVVLNGHRRGHEPYNAKLDGKIEHGRPLEYVGAHCAAHGMNSKAVGICVIGDDSLVKAGEYPTENQIKSVIHTCVAIIRKYPHITVDHIMQHSDFERGKPSCASLKEHMGRIRAEVLKAIA